MKKIPGACWIISAILMVLSAASFAGAAYKNVALLGDEDAGFYINMGTEGDDILIIPDDATSFKVYDDGGEAGDYSYDEIDNKLILAAPSGKQLQIKGQIISFGYAASLKVFDGNSVDGDTLLEASSAGDVVIVNSGRFVTIWFKAPEYNPDEGFAFEVNVVDPTVSHKISKPTVSNGSFTVDIEDAYLGDVVTITTSPDRNFFVDHITVTDASGTKIPVVKKAENTFTFKMVVATDVSVKPFFNTKVASYDDIGCLDNGTYFHIDCYEENGSGYCSLSQGLVENPKSNGSLETGKDFTCWSDLVGDLELVYSYLEISLQSDLDFGGYDESENKCVMNFKPLDDLDAFVGNGYTIRNFCMKSTSYAGFAPEDNGYLWMRNISNVTFENAHVEAPTAGVLGTFTSVSNVTIDKATVTGDNVGALMGVSVSPSNTSLISLTINGVSVVESTIEGNGNVGGLVGKAANTYITIEKSSVNGDISGSGNVGGLIGVADGSSLYRIIIQNTFTKGNISAGQNDYPGYLVGAIATTPTELTIKNNYHYGDDNVEFGVGNQTFTRDTWVDASGYTCNIRNTVTGIQATGSLYYSAIDGEYIRTGTKDQQGNDVIRANGAVAGKEMTTAKFAAVLNGSSTKMTNIWSETADINDGFPIFANETYKPIRPVGFSYIEYDSKNTNQDKRDIFYAAIGGKIMYEYCGSYCSGFNLYTDYTGHLSVDKDIAFLSTISETNGYWYSSHGKVNATTSFLDYSKDGYFKYDHDDEIEIVYVLCKNANCTSVDELTPDFESTDYKLLGFTYPPIRNIRKSNFDTPIPSLAFTNSSDIQGTDCAYNYKINSTDPNVGAIEESLGDKVMLFGAILNGVDFENTYEKKVYIYYRTGANSIDFEPYHGNGSRFTFDSYVYSLDGSETIKYQAVSSGNANFPASFKINAPVGYAVNNFSVSFRSGTNDVQSPNYIDAENEYIVSSDAFLTRNGNRDIWVKNFAGDAEVHLDSIYKSIARAGVRPTDMKLTITPELVPVGYDIVFDLNIPATVDSSDLFLGHNWASTKTVSLKSDSLPHLYSLNCPAAEGWNVSDNSADGYKVLKDLLDNHPNDISESSTNLYAYWDATGNCTHKVPTYIDYYVKNDGVQTDEPDDFHGSIELQQDVNGVKFVRHPMEKTREVTVPGPTPNDPDETYYTYRVKIPDVNDTLTFNVVAKPAVGYEAGEITYTSTPSSMVVLPTEDNLTLGYSNGVLAINPVMVSNARIIATFSLAAYKVSFDVGSLTNGYAILGKNWAASKENMDISSDHNELPQVYVMDDANPLSPDFAIAEWTPVLDENDPNYFVDNELTSDLLSHVDPLTSEFTLYPKVTGLPLGTEKIIVKAYDEDGDPLPDASVYHGSVVLKQSVSNGENAQTFEQPSSACDIDLIDTDGNVTGSENVHCLYIPDVNDTLTFKVSFVPDQDYAIKLIDSKFLWQNPTGGNPVEPPAGLGLNVTDTDTTLVINPSTMARPGMYINVMYISKNVGSYYITYDLNAIDNLGNDWSNNIYLPRGAQKTVGFPDKALRDALKKGESIYLLKPVRSNGMCFDGWTTENGRGKYTGADAIIDDPGNVRGFSTDKDNPTVLYAAWKSCDGNNVALTIDNKYRQSLELVLYQKFGEDTLRHAMGNVYNEIINLEDASYVDYMDSAKKYTGYDFSVDGENSHVYYSGDVVSEFSVVYTTDLGGKGSIDEDNGVWHITNDGIKGVPTFMFVPKKAYRLAFNENVGSSEAKAFVGTQGGLIHDWHVDELSVDSDGNWEPYITYFDTDDNKTFPKIYYRVGYCSDGYTFDPDDATNGVYTELDNDFIKKYNELGKTGEIVLYAHWKSCDNKYYTVTSPDLKYGTMSLLRHSDSYYLNMNSEREYPITAGGLKIPYVKNANNEALDVFFDEFRFEGKGDYDQLYFGKLDFLYYRAKGSDSWVSVEKDSDEKIEKYGLNNASVYDYFEVNADMEVSVRFGKHFLANASNDEVFFGPNWVWDGLYGIGDVVDDKAFSAVPDVGRAGACVVGWGEPIKDADYLVLFNDIDAMIDASAFYAIWNDTKLGGTVGAHLSFNPMDPNLLQQIGCDTTTYTIISTLKQDEPMLILTQTVGDSVFSHWVGESGLKVPAYLKNMKFSVDVEHFDNYAAKAIYVMDTQGNVLDTVAPGESFEIKGNTVIKVDLGKGDGSSIHVALNENSDDPIYFGDDWTDEISYAGGDSVELPKIVYNAEKCLAGWTTDPESDELLTVIDKDLLSKLRAKGRSQGVDVRELLYAKWTTNLDSCAGAFMKLAVEQENGSIWFAEGDKDKTIERRFTEEGTMFVPMELNGRNFRVRAMGADTSVYVLDSLVVMRDGNVDTVLHVGDYMPEILDNVTLKAYFGWKNKTKLDFARARLDSTGSMFKLSFTASDFEVRRKVSAKVQVVDIVKDSIVTQSVFGDSIAMGFDTTFVFRMKKPGNYRMVVTLEDKTGVKENFSREISVDPVISSIAADSWQMLSLSAVDMSAVTWDGDQVFYWWDEYGTGEFWQYKQLTKNDSLDATRGVWYNSLEGRPLPLRDEIDDEGEDFVWELDKANSGWNMVANPHGWAVNLFANYPDAAKDIDENPDVLFWSWNTTTGQYDPMFEEIGPYEAVWVQVSKDTKWKVSAAPAFKGESKAVEKSRSLAKSKTKDRWTLQAKLLDKNGKQDSWNILGAGLNPLTTEEPPESMADHVNLSIVDGKRALAKSIKEASDEMEWTIALSASSDRIGYLSFDGVDGVNAYGYHVFVTVDGNTTEMQNGVPLKVYLKSTAKTATVRVAPADRVVAQNTLKGLRMARLGNQLRVSFEASEGLAGTNARVDILDMKGHVMSTVTAKTLDGSNALVLDAPQTGLYMLRVRAGSEQQAKKIVVK